jgi:hypothetical protein
MRLALVALVAAFALIAGASAHTATAANPCGIWFAEPNIQNGIIGSWGGVRCTTPRASLNATVCVQEYDNVFRYWYDLSCATRTGVSGVELDVLATAHCASFPYGYRTRVHGWWTGGGSGDGFSIFKNLKC